VAEVAEGIVVVTRVRRRAASKSSSSGDIHPMARFDNAAEPCTPDAE